MIPKTPQRQCADEVVELINGETIAGEYIVAEPGRLLPEYDDACLHQLKVDVIPGSTSGLSRVSRGCHTEDCPVVIAVTKQCKTEDEYNLLMRLLRELAVLVAQSSLPTFGTPFDEVEFTDDPAAVDGRGMFEGFIRTAYQAYLK